MSEPLTALEIIRLRGGEFSEISDEILEQWIEVVRPMVSRKQFGKLYEQALALLVCHKLKLAGYGESALGELGATTVGFGIGSVSEGGSSISYGTEYLTLRRSVIVPIHVSGQES